MKETCPPRIVSPARQRPRDAARPGPTRRRLRAGVLALGLATATLAPHTVVQAEENEVNAGTELVLRALSLLGVHYRFGGSSPDTGLDCSGLVRHVFREAVGMVLPRRAVEISRAGEVIDPSQLRPGDLVFYNTLRRTFSHVGIYIGDGRFVHAPSRGGGVRVEEMSDSYWRTRFNGARRVLAEGISPDRLGLDRLIAGQRAEAQPTR
jgi:cell wall-associated NlpC family hydrolase